MQIGQRKLGSRLRRYALRTEERATGDGISGGGGGVLAAMADVNHDRKVDTISRGLDSALGVSDSV